MGQRRCLADRHCLKRLGRKMAAPAWRPLQNWNFQSPRKDDIFAFKSERAWKIWKVWKLLPSCQECSNTKYSKSHKPAPIESEPFRLGQKECVSDFLRVLRPSTLRAFSPRGTGTAECPRTFSRPCFQSWTSPIYWLVGRQRDIRTLERTQKQPMFILEVALPMLARCVSQWRCMAKVASSAELNPSAAAEFFQFLQCSLRLEAAEKLQHDMLPEDQELVREGTRWEKWSRGKDVNWAVYQ